MKDIWDAVTVSLQTVSDSSAVAHPLLAVSVQGGGTALVDGAVRRSTPVR